MTTLHAIRARCEVTATGCWRWTLKPAANGYGRLRGQDVHRLACELAHGPGVGLVARHSDTCSSRAANGTPIGAGKLCCNPAHLRWGTKAENAADAKRTNHRRERRVWA